MQHLRQRLVNLQTAYASRQHALEQQLLHHKLTLRQRYREGRATQRAHQRVVRGQRALVAETERFRQRQCDLLQQLHRHQTTAHQLRERLARRSAAREAIDTETLCRERDLEKDQMMLNFQILLANLHDWVAQNYFTAEWRTLSLEKATQMIYRKAGQVTWHADRIEVELEPYRYPDQQ